MFSSLQKTPIGRPARRTRLVCECWVTFCGILAAQLLPQFLCCLVRGKSEGFREMYRLGLANITGKGADRNFVPDQPRSVDWLLCPLMISFTQNPARRNHLAPSSTEVELKPCASHAVTNNVTIHSLSISKQHIKKINMLYLSYEQGFICIACYGCGNNKNGIVSCLCQHQSSFGCMVDRRSPTTLQKAHNITRHMHVCMLQCSLYLCTPLG